MPENNLGTPTLNQEFFSTWQTKFTQQFWNPSEIDKIGFALGVLGSGASKAFGAIEKMSNVIATSACA